VTTPRCSRQFNEYGCTTNNVFFQGFLVIFRVAQVCCLNCHNIFARNFISVINYKLKCKKC
jgi:hypothetical protein